MIAALNAALLAGSLGGVPAVAADEDAPVDDRSPADEPYEVPAPVSPPTDEQRLPLVDLAEIEGIWPADVVEADPGPADTESPEGFLEDAKLLPDEGSASTDRYGVGPDDTSHIAVVYPQDVNRLTQAGEWRDIKVELVEERSGWRWDDPSGVSTTLPTELSSATPLTISTGEGTVSVAPASKPNASEPGGTGTAAGGTDPSGAEPAAASATVGERDGETILYGGAFDHAELRYTATLGGIQEEIVLREASKATTFAFDVTTSGLTLAANDHGGVDVLSAEGKIVGVFPAPVAYDDQDEPASSTGTYALDQADAEHTRLEISIDEGFLAEAVYPVVIDPTWDDSPNRDGYTNQASPGTSYESDSYLQVNSGKRTYIRFDTGGISQSEIIVYDASMFLWPTGSGSVTGGIDAKKVSQNWPASGTLKWNNQPGVGNVFDTTSSAGGSGWWKWDVTGLYQHYIDPSNQWNQHWENEGVALTASNAKTFHSVNSTLQGSDPALYVTYNNPPENPSFKSPANNYVSETESLSLKVEGGQNNWPQDDDGDGVLVSFQISDDGQNWDGSHLIYQSPYDDLWSTTVPAGVLLDGQTYWWRAVSRDVCDNQTQALCSLTDGAGTTREPAGSTPKSFTIALSHLGSDERWHMWNHELGNSMDLQVNGSNGNLFLDVPIDSYATPIGDLGIGLAYNSQADEDYGLGVGWDLAIGPRGDHGALPLELTKLEAGNEADLQIRLRDGRVLHFPHTHNRRWGSTSAMSGYVTQAKSDKYTYMSADGGSYLFESGALNGAALLKAKPAQAAADAPDKEFTYTYNGSLQLTKVEDPLGRAIDVAWNTTDVTIDPSDFGGPAITLGLSSGVLASISTPVENPSASTNDTEVIDFAYDSGLLIKIWDGVQTDDGGDWWEIGYAGSNPVRVSTITAPDSGNPSSAPTPWTFSYHGPYTGSTVAGVCITDPRGTPDGCDAETTNDPAYETQVEFSVSGFPTEIYGPHGPAQGEEFRRLSTFVFDNHNNLVCERTPEANALGGKSCTSATNGQGQYTDLDDGGLSTVYSYQNTAPYRLKDVTRPAATVDSAFPRLLETYTYDGGSTFEGLHVEFYENDDLEGTPSAERLWTNLDQDWDGGSPGPITQGANTWGLRLSGLIDIANLQSGKKYEFRVFTDDGVRLSVEGSTILDCFGEANPDETTANCGQGTVSKVLWGSDAEIEIEYSDIETDAALTVKWDKGNGNWEVLPGSRLTPELGLVTRKTYSRVQSSSTVDLWEERWTFPTDDLKFRRLHEDHIREDLVTSKTYRTTYDYDNDYGRVESETLAADTSLEATTTYGYTDGAAPGSWDATGIVSCLSSVTDELGGVVERECDERGQVVRTSQQIDAVSGTDQTTQQRTTSTEYDSLGRPTRSLQEESGAETVTVYDLAGRVAETRTTLDPQTVATTSFVYDHAGHLLTEILPDPDGAGGEPSPEVHHEWNWVDLETMRTDERGEEWESAYDWENRLIESVSPLGATTTTTYRLGFDGQDPINQVVVDAPSGASTVADFDVAGRKVAEALDPYDPTTYGYNALGNLNLVTDPAGIETASTYTNLSELTSTTQFAQAAAGVQAVTTRTYDAAGRLVSVDGPLSGAQDETTFDYDDLGRMTEVTQAGITLPGSSTPAGVQIVYNEADERIKVSQKLTTTKSLDRYWTYDAAGREQTYRDAGGTTTNVYNRAGWLLSTDDPRGNLVVHQGFDRLGRRICRYTATCDGSTSGAETWSYDEAGNVTGATNPAESFELVYDADGRLTEVVRDSSTETSYDYDATSGLLTDITDAAGTTSLTYDAQGQVATLDDPFATSGTSSYSYDSTTGRLETRVDAQANLTWTTDYDPDTGRLDAQTIESTSPSSTLAAFELAFDKAGNVISKDSDVFSNPSDGSWTYDYDGAGRLLEATGPNASGAATTWDYAYDGGGNRIQMTETTGQDVITDLATAYDAQGLPTSAADAETGETISYAHDEIGSLLTVDSSIEANDAAYAFDAYSRMTCAEPGATSCAGAGSISYALDAFDRALSRTDDTGTTNYVYQGTSEQLAAETTGGTMTAFAYSGGSTPLAQKVGTNDPSYLLVDTHADVVGLVSDSAAEQGTRSFDPWGQLLGTSGTQSMLGYQGDITDPGSGLVDMGTRWYVPGQARFNARDVLFGDLSSPMMLNQHAYGGMSPITMWDPTGMGQCTMPGECVSSDGSGGTRAVGGNPGAANHPYHGVSGVYSPSPPRPEPAPPISYERVRTAINLPAATRLQVIDRFFASYPGTSALDRRGFGRGLYDFTAWEERSGRLDASEWWRATNGLMVLDLRDAMRELSRGDGRSQNAGVQAWIDYARAATSGASRTAQQAAFWHAHQTSLHDGMRSPHTTALLGGEYTASPGGATLAMDQIIVQNVDHAAINNWASDTPLLGKMAEAGYGGYPSDALSLLLADVSGYSDPNTGIGSTRRW